MKTDRIINRIKNAVRSIDPVAEVYLFGSRARKDHHKGSDWDILILVDKDKITKEIEDLFRDPLYDIELDTGQLISIFIYAKSFWEQELKFFPLYEDIENEGLQL